MQSVNHWATPLSYRTFAYFWKKNAYSIARDVILQPYEGRTNANGTSMRLFVALLRRARRALEGGPSGRHHLLGVGREDSGWGWGTTEGALPRFWHHCSQRSTVCGPSFHSWHVGSAVGPYKRAHALRSSVCPDRRQARRTAPARFVVAMQSAFQEKFSYTMATRGLCPTK